MTSISLAPNKESHVTSGRSQVRKRSLRRRLGADCRKHGKTDDFCEGAGIHIGRKSGGAGMRGPRQSAACQSGDVARKSSVATIANGGRQVHVGIIYPDQPKWPKMRWVHEALLSLGHRVDRARDASGFPELSQTCDLVLLTQKGFGGRWPDLKAHFPKRKAVVAQWWFDLIAVQPEIPLAMQGYLSPDNHLPLMRGCDFVFVKEASMLPEFHALGVKAYHLDQGCAVDAQECVRSESPTWDVLLWGQAYPERTADAVALADAGMTVAWAGCNRAVPRGVESLPWCQPNDLPKLAGKSSCILSCDKRNDVPGYWSDRFWMALGMGCCVLRRETPGLPDGPFIVYRDRAELVERTKELLAAHGDRSAHTPGWSPRVLQFGKEAREWSLQNHTLAHRCRQLLEIVGVHNAKGLVA